MDPFLGEIRAYPYGFVPANWAACDGRTLPIRGYVSLFSILGTAFGGDGSSTFALPNLVGTVPVGTGRRPGNDTSWNTGQTAGSTTAALGPAQLAAHTHTLNATSTGATGTGSAGQQLALASTDNGSGGSTDVLIYATAAPDTALDPGTLAQQGGGQSHPNMMPYLALNYCIALTGLFPDRP